MKSTYKRAMIVVPALIVVVYLFSPKEKEAPRTTVTTAEQKPDPTPPPIWIYSENEDKMTGKKNYFANCTSTNTIYFEFPYDGGSEFYLIVRKMNGENDVILKVSKGQFMTSYSGDETISVKFDESPPVPYRYSSSDDGSSDVIFINSANTFISKVKKAKKLMIQAPFYSAGRQVIEFDVTGLEWNR